MIEHTKLRQPILSATNGGCFFVCGKAVIKVAKFVVKKAQNTELYWHFVANNGKLVCWSGETFRSREALDDNIKFVKTYTAGATVEVE